MGLYANINDKLFFSTVAIPSLKVCPFWSGLLISTSWYYLLVRSSVSYLVMTCVNVTEIPYFGQDQQQLLLILYIPRSKCSASAAHWQCLCSAALPYTAWTLKCIRCKHTAASQCMYSVHYTAVRSVSEVWMQCTMTKSHFSALQYALHCSVIAVQCSVSAVPCSVSQWSIMHFAAECNAL